MLRFSRLIPLVAVLLAGCDLIDRESSDASLSAISITGAALSPSFAPFTFSYTATVDPDTDSIAITVTPADGKARVDINGRTTRNSTVPLDVGTNEISIIVLSENRKRRAVYTVVVTRIEPTYSVGGTVSGLNGDLTLQNNGGDDLAISADGAFTFATALDDGADFDVTVATQPVGQICTVTNGTGTISGSDVSDVVVSCADDVAGEFRIYANVSGLVGDGIVQLNGANDVLLTRDGLFAFITALADGADYEVTVSAQPAGQTCTVSNGTGTIAGDNILDVEIDCAGAGMASSSIFDWDWVNPLPGGNPIMDFATDGTTLVAVGGFGMIQTSMDGLSWTRRDAGTGHTIIGIEWTGSEFLAATDQGSILSSSDGIAWQTRTSVPFLNPNDLVSTGSLHVIVGYSSLVGEGLIATSTDGESWSQQTINPPGSVIVFGGVAWNGNTFVAVQSPDFVHVSADGTNWTTSQIDTPGTASELRIASDGNRFVAVDLNGLVYTSVDDGATWVRETETLPAGTNGVFWDGTRFVVPGVDQYATSIDGTSWTSHALVTPTFTFAQALTRFNGLNIMAFGTGAIYTSPDDVSWTTPFTNAFGNLWDVIRQGAQFVAVGNDSTVLTSPDGTTWTTRNSSPGVNLFGVTFGGGQYVAVGVGNQDQILTSPDAITWTSHTAGMDVSLQNVDWGNGLYVAVGFSGVMTSPDGVTWTAQTAGFIGDETLLDVAWNGSVWVITGYRIDPGFSLETFTATSPDGITWTKHPLADLFYFDGIDWNGTRFVAAGTGVIGTSSDGVNWSLLGTNASINDVSWSGSEFIAAGFYPEILVSPDGLDWSVLRSRSGGYQGIASDGTTFVVVSFNGHILTGTP